MRKLILIDETYVKSNSLIEINVDTKVLSRTIINVQENELKDVLGVTLYNSIVESVYNKEVSNIPISNTYTELLYDYIYPYLLHQTIANYIINNHYKLTNKGLLRLTDRNSDNIGNTELEYFKDYYDNYSASYKKNLIDYLRTNKLTNENDLIDTDVTSNSIGWYLENDDEVKCGITISPSTVNGLTGTFSVGSSVFTINNGVIVDIQ